MSQILNDFLAREAGDYLDRMRRLLTSADSPDRDELSRLARGVRGSAQMAGAADVAELAERLEEQLRARAALAADVDDDARERLLQAVGELEDLLYARSGDVIPISDLLYARSDDVIPISDLLYDDETGGGAPAPGRAEESAAAVVPIQELLYSGRAAIEAADGLRSDILDAVAGGDRSRALGLLDELFDLIRLAGSAST